MLVPEGASRLLVKCGLCLILATAFADPVRADSAQYFYDAAGQLSAVVDPVNGTVVYTYDAAGNLTQVLRPTGATVIATANPSSAPPGATVTISGAGFGNLSNTSVSFNGVAATLTAVSASQITAIVPSSATTGPMMVTSPTGTSVNPFIFSVTQPPPTIASIPTSAVNPNDIVTIYGNNFSSVLGNNRVKLNGRTMLVNSVSISPSPNMSTLTFTIPAVNAASIVSSGPVQVETPAGSATTSSNLIVNPNSTTVFGPPTSCTLTSCSPVTIASSGQTGQILFNATAGQLFYAQITSLSFSSGNNQAAITLYGPDGQNLSQYSGFYTPGEHLQTRTLPLTGTYTLTVSPQHAGDTGTATITPVGIPADATGTASIDGPAVPLSSTVAGQTMQVNFTATANQKFQFTLTTTGSNGGIAGVQYPNNGAYLGYYDGSGIWQTFIDVGSPNTYTVGPFTAPITGSYTIRFGPDRGINSSFFLGSATFQLFSVTSMQAKQAERALPTTVLTTSTPGQTVKTSFKSVAGHSAWIAIDTTAMKPEQGDFYVRVVAPDGHTLLRGDQSSGPHYGSGQIILPTSGQYDVLITAADAAIGSYHVRVNEQ